MGRKLVGKTKEMVSVGVGANGASLKLYNSRTKQIIETRQAVFDELVLGLPGSCRHYTNGVREESEVEVAKKVSIDDFDDDVPGSSKRILDRANVVEKEIVSPGFVKEKNGVEGVLHNESESVPSVDEGKVEENVK